MREVRLTRGLVACVDDADFAEASKHNWAANPYGDGKWRAFARIDGVHIYMHRWLMRDELAVSSLVVDHIDGNGLNNQRSNLRVCTQRDNARNQRRSSGNSTGYKGVNRVAHNRRKQFRAYIGSGVGENGETTVRVHLGWFLTAEEAARAYDAAARERFGSYAALNFPLPGEQGVKEVEHVVGVLNPAEPRRKIKGCASIYPGVTKHKNDRWWGRVWLTGGKFISCKTHATPEAAYEAVKRVAAENGIILPENAA